MGVIVVGRFGAEHREEVAAAVARAQSSMRFAANIDQARELLRDDDGTPRCIFVDTTLPDLGAFVLSMRSQAALFSVPIFATVQHVADQPFAHAHALGVDAVLWERDMGAITRHVAAVPASGAIDRPLATQGTALVVHGDPLTRQLYARIVRQAGFDATFASTHDEWLAGAANKPRVVIADCAIADEALAVVAEARARAGAALLAHVLVGQGDHFEAVASAARGREGLDTLSGSAPPDHLLFVVNELLRREQLRGQGHDQRASARALFGTLCSFRTAGQIQPVFGFTYNISREGLYVKTYEAPAAGTELWLELRPPDDLLGVHLRGRVMWSRRPNPSAAAAAPPGFGFRIDSEACPPADRAQYDAAYERLIDQP